MRAWRPSDVRIGAGSPRRELSEKDHSLMAVGGTSAKKLTLLFSCVGRRVELVQAFRAAARRLGVELSVIGTDTSPIAPALACVDEPVIAPPIRDPGYVPQLLELVRSRAVDALIPTIDTDLPQLAANRDAFDALGCRALIADSSVIRICSDKVETFRFLRAAGIDTPDTYLPDEIRAIRQPRFPLFIKPRYGSASIDTHKIDDQLDLDYFLRKHGGRDPIVQEFVVGAEHTLDVYVGLGGVPRCVVPRLRMQTRGGEVTQGVVLKDREVMEAGRAVVEKFGTSARGVVTLQCIVTGDRRIRFIEINPRFGGGAPLGIAAGADYPSWLIQELLGGAPWIEFDGFTHGLCVSRYDWAAFLPLGADAKPRLAKPLRGFPQFE